MGVTRKEGDSSVPWVDGLTIGQVLQSTARRFPDDDAFVFCAASARMTWAEFDADVNRIARGLLGLGFVPGDHFGVWATNVPQWVLLQFATARIGVVLVNINPSYRASELAYALQQSDVRGLALIDHYKSSHFLDMLCQTCPELASASPGQLQSKAFPKLEWIIALRGNRQPYALMWDQLYSRGESVSQQRVEDIANALRPTDAINIQYTSGTTGHPKGAMLSHRNVLLNAFYAGRSQRLDHRDRICLPVPLYHCFGCVLGTMVCVVHGSAMIFPAESFSAEATLGAIEHERCTSLYGVPTMFIAELEHPDYPQRNLTSLRTGIMAGSPCPIELMKRVTEEMGANEITIGYGQTEASPLITQTRTDDPIELRVGTVGQTLPGFEAKIIDPDTGQELGDGVQGEFCGRGHGVMIGYYHMPDRTAAAIDADGWLHTGDLGMRQSNGYYRITGRLHDMIIRGGENIYPREIEERLYEHPAVEDVQVVGVPDRRFGEEVLAWVKLKRGDTATEAELREFCGESLSRFKVPRYWKFVERFPTTVTGKIQKFKIREQAITELGLHDIANIETA
ncbi:Long-chain-fatty-acid--CoA ligase [Novipirellula galeiformis]|uniref:Long-chain-fatty-acid--CoA ligase n=1 Tax=Novipirellula galeiformis TaxID=2528004 RepID=A0A5C6CPJ8_9BACT|nr:AMP-binding protein [Novipirellula galeiformis]TWU25404.1 Long-chain-fatty-acid--CoA ligase [Novipirellula galeiformis]